MLATVPHIIFHAGRRQLTHFLWTICLELRRSTLKLIFSVSHNLHIAQTTFYSVLFDIKSLQPGSACDCTSTGATFTFCLPDCPGRITFDSGFKVPSVSKIFRNVDHSCLEIASRSFCPTELERPHSQRGST
jgi:hypothetical protein